MTRSVQLNLPPTEVQSVNRSAARSVKAVNPLRWVRDALVRSQLPQRWLAAVMDISESLLSAQLSDHNPDKHLSARRLGRVDDVGFWKEFALLVLEDLGLYVVVMTREQHEAYSHLTNAATRYARESAA